MVLDVRRSRCTSVGDPGRGQGLGPRLRYGSCFSRPSSTLREHPRDGVSRRGKMG